MMLFNRITLAFQDEEEKLFLEKYFTDSLLQVRASLIVLSALYGAFGYLDYIMFPEYSSLFHIIRFAFVIPSATAVLIVSYTKVFSKIWQQLLLLLLIIGGTGITAMIIMVPENYTYYSGMMLVFSAGYFLIKLRFFLATLASWTILFIYDIVVIFYAHAPSTEIINTNFFFISANLIGMFAAYNIEYYTRRNFLLNLELDKEKLHVVEINKNLEKTVEERTNELLMAKEAAEAENANVTAIIEGTQESIWAFNRSYEILYINRGFQREYYQTFGIRLEPGVNLLDSLPVTVRPQWKSRYDRVLNNEQFTVEDKVDSVNGPIYIQVSFNPIYKKGKVAGGSCLGSNITTNKLAELELLKAKEKAVKSDRLKSAFLANMSHEIRTPMNGILGFSELLKNPELTGDQQQKYIKIIEKSGTRMLNIINNIVDISKIEAGLMKPDLKETNINEQMEDIYSFFKPEVEAKGMILTYRNDLPANESIIYTDPEKTYAILTNLIKNAVKHSRKGSIEFGYFKKGDSLEFYVKDTGFGIQKDMQESIFERFVQAEIGELHERQGAGLGLSITKAYVEMLGGKIWLVSFEGIGSSFYFSLPYEVPFKKSGIQKYTPSGDTKVQKSQTKPSLNVLIAEDDETSEMLLSILAETIGKKILQARTGREAVEILRDNPDIDLVLMDIQMPELSGYEATRQIRQFNSEVVIIAQTAFGLADDRAKAIAAGCNDYLSKPIDISQFLTLIDKYFKV